MLWYSLDSLVSMERWKASAWSLSAEAKSPASAEFVWQAYAWSPNVCTRIGAIWSQYLADQQFGAWKGTMMWMGEVARARSLGKHV